MKLDMDAKKLGLFVGGVVFGTAGLGILASKEAKKLYTNCTAACLRAKDCVLDKVAKIQVEAEDIVAEAKEMNETRYTDCDSVEEVVAEDPPKKRMLSR